MHGTVLLRIIQNIQLNGQMLEKLNEIKIVNIELSKSEGIPAMHITIAVSLWLSEMLQRFRFKKKIPVLLTVYVENRKEPYE